MFDYPRAPLRARRGPQDIRFERKGRRWTVAGVGAEWWRKVALAGRSPGRDRKPTIDYRACYYEEERRFFRDQKLVFNAGFVAFFCPEGAPVGNNYIIEPYDHALRHYTRFAVRYSGLWEPGPGKIRAGRGCYNVYPAKISVWNSRRKLSSPV